MPSIPTSKVGQRTLVLAQEIPQYQLHIVCIRIQYLSTDDIDQRVGEGIHVPSLHLTPEVVYKGCASGKCGLAPTIATTAPRPHHLSYFLHAAIFIHISCHPPQFPFVPISYTLGCAMRNGVSLYHIVLTITAFCISTLGFGDWIRIHCTIPYTFFD